MRNHNFQNCVNHIFVDSGTCFQIVLFAIFVEIILSVLEAGNTSAAFDPSDIWEGGKSAKLNTGTLTQEKKHTSCIRSSYSPGSCAWGDFYYTPQALIRQQAFSNYLVKTNRQQKVCTGSGQSWARVIFPSSSRHLERVVRWNNYLPF